MGTTSLENLINIEYSSTPLSIEYTEDSMLISVLGDTIINTESIEENFSIGYTELFTNVELKDGDTYNVNYASPSNFKVYQSEEVVNIYVAQGFGSGGIPITLENHIPGLGILGNNYNGSTEQTWNLAFAGSGIANTVARSDHNHNGVYLTEESDPTVPSYVKAITQSEIFSWNLAYSWGDHAEAGYLTEENDPIYSAWQNLNERFNGVIPVWNDLGNLTKSPISLESVSSSNYIDYVLGEDGTILDPSVLYELFEDNTIVGILIGERVRILDIPNSAGNFLTENKGIVSKRSIEEVVEDLDIDAEIYTFTIMDWLTMGGGYYIEISHTKGEKYTVGLKDSGNKKVSVSDIICTNNLVRMQIPYDFRFEGKLIINN